MRVLKLEVEKWRNLRDVVLEVPEDASLVCLVGENGTGKSTVLELLSIAAHHMGISPGVDNTRGNPLAEHHSVRITARVPGDPLELAGGQQAQLEQTHETWDGRLRFESLRTDDSHHTRVVADGIVDDALAQNLGNTVVSTLRQRQETQHLFLDADRAYPPIQILPQHFQEIWNNEWDNPEWTRQFAYRPTKTLYEEWIKYFIGTEERISTEFISEMRRAKQVGEDPPAFVDPFEGYRDSVAQVLPHLLFTGIESSGANRTIVFDSAGLRLPFSRLSGGEREIAFLIGQIERFQLRRGLLLIDEPELHLNPDLLRTWLAFLRDTVDDGQAWIATHSLEAVEVAGLHQSFVFERDTDSRLVDQVSPLSGRPVLSALSAAVGAPAFSIERLRFVYVEGDRQTRERERFFSVCGDAALNRFIEGGSCTEVLRRLADVQLLADETGEQLHVGAVIDRDFRSDDEAAALEAAHGVHVLRCFEIENLFLQPEALAVVQAQGNLGLDVTTTLKAASDRFAGLWVAQRAGSAINATVAEIPKSALAAFGNVVFDALQADWANLALRE